MMDPATKQDMLANCEQKSFAAIFTGMYFKTQVSAETIATLLWQRQKQKHSYCLHEYVQAHLAVSLHTSTKMPPSGGVQKTKQKKNRENMKYESRTTYSLLQNTKGV